MKPITKLASTTLPDGSILDLWERDGFHFLLRDGVQLASSFSHGSNEAAAAMAAAPVKRANQPAFLLGEFLFFRIQAGDPPVVKYEQFV